MRMYSFCHQGQDEYKKLTEQKNRINLCRVNECLQKSNVIAITFANIRMQRIRCIAREFNTTTSLRYLNTIQTRYILFGFPLLALLKGYLRIHQKQIISIVRINDTSLDPARNLKIVIYNNNCRSASYIGT